MVEKMRAMVLSKLGPIESKPLKITEIDKHQIKRDNEILIKIEACGVCHSQLHGIEGDWKDLGIPPTLPTVPGHEIAGKVVEIGKDVTKFKVDDKAGISPLLDSCMKCQYCNKDGHTVNRCFKKKRDTRNNASSSSSSSNSASQNNSTTKCSHCNKKGHQVGQCWIKNPALKPKGPNQK